ncbi:hypothetical protein ACP8HI_04465 [Paenibacillus sp. FA6]|uniref:hypothetical protein n=1 Tax=Paenibacillus sp. FA6 TaxID=3413029 RepID=UPI003F65AE30
MLDDVKKRLETFGYVIVDGDAWVLGFIIQKIENHIKSQTNLNEIPIPLHQNAVDMVVGEFLLSKKSVGQLTGWDLDTAVKSIQEGDTNITFALDSGSMTPEARLNALINFLMREGDYAFYRVIKW